MAEVRVAWDKLQEFTKQVFMQVGMSPADAETEAEVCSKPVVCRSWAQP